MLLGFNTNGLQSHRLEDGLRLLADLGFQWVALTPDVGHLDPFHCTAREVDRIGALLERLRLGVTIETGARFVLDPTHKHEPTLMTADPAGVARRLDFYDRCARLGADLGAEVLSFWAGIDHSPGDDSAQRLQDGVAATVERVRQRGLRPALEPEPGMALETLAEFDTLALELGPSAPELCFDIGHVMVTREGDPAALCRSRASACAQVHLEDMRPGIHEHLEPGAGEMDFDRVLTSLSEGGYGGPVCFELSRSGHRAPAALSLCAEVWRRHVTAKGGGS